MVLMILVSALVAILFYYFVIKQYDYWKNRGVKQGNPVWIFGDNWRQVFRLHSLSEMVQHVYNQFPGTRYSGIYQFLTPTLVVKDPELLKKVTVKDFDHFVDHRTFTSDIADPLFTNNLASLKGEKWRDMRSILSPSFTSSKMKSMFVLISDCAQNFVQHFLKKDEEVLSLEMKDIFSRFTNDVIATTAFGLEVDSLGEPNNQFYTMGKKVTDFTGLWRNLKFFGYFLFPKLYNLLKIRFLSKEEGDFFLNIVDTTVKAREEGGIVRPDMIHLLMEARKGNQKYEENGTIDAGFATAQESELSKNGVNGKIHREITNEIIASQAMIFFFAGFDALSSLMSFAAYELAMNPEVQEKLRKEIFDTLDKSGGKLTYEGLAKMKYMDMVISESLRKWPNAVATDRICTKPYTIEPVTPEEKPVHLEKGTLLMVPIIGIHRDPAHFPNPNKFDPERFSDENKDKIKPYTYFPFGLGPRNCIGSRFALLETKAAFFHILSKFELVPTERTQIPLKISRKSFNMNADGGFWVGMKRIKG